MNEHSSSPAAIRPSAGTTTLLFTDIEGSTGLLERLRDRYAGLLADHHRLLRGTFAEHGGNEIDSAGDGFYYSFISARAALAAAVDAQRALMGHAWPDGVEVKVRMGLHTGEPVSGEVGLVGIDVHRAARICAAGHGGQILLSRTARDLAGRELPAGVSLADLGEHRLRGLIEPQQLFQVVAEGLPAQFPRLNALDDRRTNLPRRLSSFVGRERELAEAAQLMRAGPLLTLTGPGGVGKTRLSLQVALSLADEFPDGIWLVELGALTDDALLTPAIASSLRLIEEPGRDLMTTLIDHLQARRLCLLLDNCEHLLEACAEVAYRILSSSDVGILATSREALGVEGEHVYPVGPLELPEQGARVALNSAAHFDAVRLFVDRARAAQSAFVLSERNVGPVVQICQRLDGIPLALELAAARVRALPVEELAARLDDRFRLLTGGSRVAVTRHQTLRATVDWSHELLGAEERAVFRRLAVFAGGCSLPAAEAVTADGSAAADVLDVITRLFDKSLVTADPQATEARYGMLETVRQYARERLLEAGEAEETFRRHRDWYLELVERAKPDFFRGPPPARWLDVFDDEYDNLRVALEWSLADADAARTGMRLAAGLWRYWEIRSKFVEGRQWLERTLVATAGEVSTLRANALTGAGNMANAQGDYAAALRFHEQSLEQHRQLGHRPSVAYALHNLANVAAEQGDLARAAELHREGISMALTIGDERGAAIGSINLADVLSRQGRWAEAQPIFEQTVELFDRFGDRWGMAFALDNEALAAGRSGNLEMARQLHERALGISRQLADERGVARSLMHLADTAAQEGDLTRAKSLHRECLRIRRALHDMPGIATQMERLAATVMADATEDAARLLGAAQLLRETYNAPVPAGARGEYEGLVQRAASRLGQEVFEAARLAGRSLGPDLVVDVALGDGEPAPSARPARALP